MIAAVCALLALAGAAYFGLSVWAAVRFGRKIAEDLAPKFRAASQPDEVAKGTRSPHV